MATDMEAVNARLAYHVDAIPEMKCHCDMKGEPVNQTSTITNE